MQLTDLNQRHGKYSTIVNNKQYLLYKKGENLQDLKKEKPEMKLVRAGYETH